MIDPPDPNSIDTLPDLIMDDDHHSYPLHMHSNQPRRTYHPSEPTAMPPVTHQPHLSHQSHPSVHSVPSPVPVPAHSAIAHPLVHPVQHTGLPSTQNHDHHLPAPPALALPGSSQHQHSHPHRAGMNGAPDIFTHSGTYASLDAFQNRLGELQNTLNESMAKWAREQDPNQEIPHHEGLGL